MEIFKVENLSFSYPSGCGKVLENISFTVNKGEFVLLCGKSGCGKTTLLRLLKTALSPFGEISGSIYFNSKILADCDTKEQASEIGFVMQNPDNQIVTDTVWHELAFGLESLGLNQNEIRTRVSEMASFFGMQNWFYKKVTQLSGGQKQLLNLAAVMAMQPSVLIVDEPTSQLDPIAAGEFLKTLEKINRELGTTIILTEHRLEEAFPMADKVIVMNKGKIIANETPEEVGKILKIQNHDMYKALPTPVRVCGAVSDSQNCPLTIRDGRVWLEEYSKITTLNPHVIPEDASKNSDDTIIEFKNVWFRYQKDLPDVVKGLSLSISKGELFCILGGNGTGKTTALALLSGLYSPYRGDVLIKGQSASKIRNLYNGLLGVLPQNPQSVFVKNTVYLDLMDILSESKLSKEEKEQKVHHISDLCRIENLLGSHPYDLSGGEQQRAALAKVLLMQPEILLLDEPTKGMDANFKEEFASILASLKASGVTIVMVSHDIEFCAEYADRCGLMFDGSITSSGMPRKFFKGKHFYTTAANRMARTCLPDAVLAEDIILACGGNEQKPRITEKHNGNSEIKPQKDIRVETKQVPQAEQKLTKKTFTFASLIFLLIPFTVYIGTLFSDHRKYYFISLLIILETLIPFFMTFETRRPKARELVIISVLCAIAVAGRTAFASLPQFKPVVALVIITGVCFGGETGFLVGAVTGFVSNFFLGQGPWTPWQMFAFGVIGFVAGILFKKGFLRKTRTSLCIFGFLATFVIYGIIMNSASILMWQSNITWDMVLSACIMGAPFDLIHSLSTAFFLWFISVPMIEKIERIKTKYGLLER